MSGEPEGNTAVCVRTRVRRRHCGVEDPTHAWKLHAREPRDPVAIRDCEAADRWEKAMSYKTHANGNGESHSGIVPGKRANAGRGGPKETVEGRLLTKENAEEPNPYRTPSRESGSSGLDRVRQAAKGDKQLRLTALLHHVNIELLRRSYYNLQRQAAAGVDGVTWQEYGDGLEERLTDLHGRIHRGAYRAKPSRRVWIPKADGRQRPLGIAALEDKIVQAAVVQVLNQIWEEDFLDFSYGFRPGRSQHDALDALYVGITSKKVNYILDLDIRSFFDKVGHDHMEKFVRHRMGDERLVRLILKWMKAGVMEEGQWFETKEGTPQGSVISPVLANLYLHCVLDLWANAWRRKVAHGDMIVVRYADDAVFGFQHREEAEKFLAEGKPETFNFLGFTHICGKNHKTGYFMVYRKTVGKPSVMSRGRSGKALPVPTPPGLMVEGNPLVDPPAEIKGTAGDYGLLTGENRQDLRNSWF